MTRRLDLKVSEEQNEKITRNLRSIGVKSQLAKKEASPKESSLLLANAVTRIRLRRL